MSKTGSRVKAPRTPKGEPSKVTIANQDKQIRLLTDRVVDLAEARDRGRREVPVPGKIGLKDALRLVDRMARHAGDLRHRGARQGHRHHGGAPKIAGLRVDPGLRRDPTEALVESEIGYGLAFVGNDHHRIAFQVIQMRLKGGVARNLQ